ncbi:ABC transporter substrate-binding protein [Microvirga alba]|uniref:ABC transporter substrate-binding protein n=1 Tax=Microvirga alba TaxID=2791025 RepID=A0A931BP39_9HYPH|nr:ABC transporter substrate-binding protein [Microvirga alba]MBF9234856.1 ABC transporter substrate-binding protein [Microvirga alba]
MRFTKTIGTALALMTSVAAAQAAPEKIKIGYISTLSGPAGSLGEEMLNAYRLGLEHTGGKLGGIPVELVTGDDQAKPQTAVQVARQMMERDKVSFFSGLLFSHVVDAVNAVVLPRDQIVVAPVGGSSETAGEKCNQNFFMVSWNTDTMFEAIGSQIAKSGIDKVAVIATNYQAGWDAAEGFKRGYGKAPTAEILVKLDQSDFGAELSQIRAADPKAVVVFLPGGSGIAFMRQFQQSGLQRTVVPYAATFQADETTFQALGTAAKGLMNAGPWSPYLDNPSNKRFVQAFREKYGRNPSILAAMSYDTVLLLDKAVSDAKGDVENPATFREALRRAKFPSIRGDIHFGNNHFPVQNFYLSKVADASGGGLHNELVGSIFEQRADAHQAKCTMKW